MRISSEDQLESLASKLFLMVYRLSEMPESDQAMSLNSLVQHIEQKIAESEAIEQFSRKLAAYGYAPLAEYDAPRFLVTDTMAYRVVEGFPRLVRSLIPQGISRISYDIELESIRPYVCEQTEFLGSA